MKNHNFPNNEHQGHYHSGKWFSYALRYQSREQKHSTKDNNMSKLNIDQKTIMQLFADKKTDFLIPDYQRPYAIKKMMKPSAEYVKSFHESVGNLAYRSNKEQ